jgi:hypothetical protein
MNSEQSIEKTGRLKLGERSGLGFYFVTCPEETSGLSSRNLIPPRSSPESLLRSEWSSSSTGDSFWSCFEWELLLSPEVKNYIQRSRSLPRSRIPESSRSYVITLIRRITGRRLRGCFKMCLRLVGRFTKAGSNALNAKAPRSWRVKIPPESGLGIRSSATRSRHSFILPTGSIAQMTRGVCPKITLFLTTIGDASRKTTCLQVEILGARG